MTVDMTETRCRPYFLWDEDISIAELRRELHDEASANRVRLLGKMLREARDIDVWSFLTPREVAHALATVSTRLGRRRAFWEFLIRGWRDDGLLERP